MQRKNLENKTSLLNEKFIIAALQETFFFVFNEQTNNKCSLYIV